MTSSAGGTLPRIGVLVVAYNAASTLDRVLDRIPTEFRSRIDRVLVGDDASQDATYLVGLGYQQIATDLRVEVVRHPQNLGYGGNQKAGYRWAIDSGLDIVVLLHGDGQYAPELLPEMVAPLERDEADAVFGSRMMTPGHARRGGMPAYKYVGNRILTTVQNRIAGLELSEWHSGYRAYSVAALADLPFEQNSDGFDFDTQIIIQLKEAGKRIAEIPIPTYYGDEICHVNGMRYAKDVVTDVARYRAHKMGFGTGELAFERGADEVAGAERLDPSHRRILHWLDRGGPARILVLGCGDGILAGRLRMLGHEVTGVDVQKTEGIAEQFDRFVEADIQRGIPAEVGDDFDVVVAADVVQRVREPQELLRQCRAVVAPGGRVVVSVPNFAHWYPRLRVLSGFFDYDQRGILAAEHVRFFTRASFERLVAGTGLRVRRREAVGTPRHVVRRGASDPTQPPQPTPRRRRIDDVTLGIRPTLFAYQFIYELERGVAEDD